VVESVVKPARKKKAPLLEGNSVQSIVEWPIRPAFRCVVADAGDSPDSAAPIKY